MRIHLKDYRSTQSKNSLLAKLARRKIPIFIYLFIHSFQKAELLRYLPTHTLREKLKNLSCIIKMFVFQAWQADEFYQGQIDK